MNFAEEGSSRRSVSQEEIDGEPSRHHSTLASRAAAKAGHQADGLVHRVLTLALG
jgi:hypothetical protein